MKESLSHCTDLELKQSSELSVLLNINRIDAGYFDSQILSLFIKWGEVYAKVELWVRVEQVVIGHNAQVPGSSFLIYGWYFGQSFSANSSYQGLSRVNCSDNFMVG